MKRLMAACMAAVLVLFFSACGKKAETVTEEISPARKAFEAIEAFEKAEPENYKFIELKYRDYCQKFPLASYTETASQRADQARLKRAEAALNAADTYRLDNPRDKEGIEQRYKAFIKEFEGTPLAAKAEAALAEAGIGAIKGQVEWRLVPDGSPLDVELSFKGDDLPADAYGVWSVGDKTYEKKNTVIHAFEAPAVYPVTFKIMVKGEAAAEFKGKVEIDELFVGQILNNEIEAINQLILDGRFDEAASKAAVLTGWTIPGFAQKTQPVRGMVDTTITNVKQFFTTLFKFYDPRTDTFNYPAAIEYVKSYLKQDASDLERRIVEKEYEKLKDLEGAYKTAEQWFKGLIGKEVRIGGVLGTVTNAGRGSVAFQTASGVAYEKAMTEIRSAELVKIIEESQAATPDPYRFGLLKECLGQIDEAMALFEQSDRPDRDMILKLARFKKGVHSGFTAIVAEAKADKRAQAERRIELEEKAAELFGMHEQVISADLDVIGIAETYAKIKTYPEYQEYQDCCADLRKVAESNAVKTQAKRRIKEILEKRPTFKDYQELGEKILASRDNDEITALRRKQAEIKDGWNAEVKALLLQWQALKDQQKARLAEIDKVYAGMREWDKKTLQGYIDQLDHEIVEIKVQENREGFHRGDDPRGTPYDRLEKAIQANLFIHGQYQYLFQKRNLEALYSFIYSGLIEDQKVFTVKGFTLAHKKLFLGIELDKARLTFAKFFGG